MPVIPIRSDLRIGRGVDSATGISKTVAVNFDPPPPSPSGQVVVADLVLIDSSDKLVESLNLNFSASFKKGLGGGSAEFSMSQSYEINQYYTYALLKVKVKNAPQLVVKPRLSAAAEEFVTKRGWEEFFRQFGDQFVEGIITGGSYYALIEIQTSDRTEQKNTTSKLSGFFGAFKASANVQSYFEEMQ